MWKPSHEVRTAQIAKGGGFTLIELLVVIAIISILSTVVLIGGDVARARGRDANRVAQVRQMQTAFELYFMDHDEYPSDRCDGDYVGCDWAAAFTAMATELRDEGYLGEIPEDPGKNPEVYYQYQKDYEWIMCGNVRRPIPNYVLMFRGETDITSGFISWLQTENRYKCLMP